MGEWKSTHATSSVHVLNAASLKGTDTTFGSFPSRLTHVLSETIDNVRVESIVFPAYEVWLYTCHILAQCVTSTQTKGDLVRYLTA